LLSSSYARCDIQRNYGVDGVLAPPGGYSPSSMSKILHFGQLQSFHFALAGL
jgi:hypothetical protein